MKKVLVIFLALAALAAFAMYQQQIMTLILKYTGMEKEKTTPIKGIAVLSDSKKNVAIKRASETTWNPGTINEPLAIMDSVSTGLESSALVRFDLGYLMNIGEQSLVVIEDPRESTANIIEVGFDQGFLQAQTTEKVTPESMLRIKSNNTVTEVKGKTDLSMAVDKKTKKAQIWIKIGEAKVKDSKGTVITIKQNEKKEISTDTIEPEPEMAPPPPMPEEEQKTLPKKIKKEKRLTRNQIMRAVAKQRKKIDTCYERNRKTATGRHLAVKITVKNTGIISNASIVRSNIDDAAVERCVIFWVKAIKFPKFDGGAISETVNFAFQ